MVKPFLDALFHSPSKNQVLTSISCALNCEPLVIIKFLSPIETVGLINKAKSIKLQIFIVKMYLYGKLKISVIDLIINNQVLMQ